MTSDGERRSGHAAPANRASNSTSTSKSGLLARQVRYADTPIGMVPTQVDYSDYRDVAGVKMPFNIVITWTDGQSNIT